jgi:hypothetical protein
MQAKNYIALGLVQKKERRMAHIKTREGWDG